MRRALLLAVRAALEELQNNECTDNGYCKDNDEQGAG